MKKIIVPVDFSKDSVSALNAAIWIAQKTGAEILMTHVNKIKQFPSFFTGTRTSENPEDIQRNFNELLSNTDAKGIAINHVVLKGSVESEINKLAESNEAYMIIMGTHGASGSAKRWAGSNAYNVISHAPCPVLSMRGSEETLHINKIVMPIDTTISSRNKVPFTLELAKAFEAEIHILAASMNSSDEFVFKAETYARQAADYIDGAGVRYILETVTGDNLTDITIEYAQKVNADLISIMTEQEMSVSSMFMGPYAQQMVHHSPIPVLTMHRNANLMGDFSIM